MRRAIGLAAAAVLLVGTAACSEGPSADPPDVEPGPTTQPTPPPTADSGATSTPPDSSSESAPADDDTSTDPPGDAEATSAPEPELDPVLDVEDEVGAVGDITGFTCEADDDGLWSASGSAENPTDQDAVYVVTIAVIDSEDRSSLVRRNVVLDVPAGEAVDFEEADLVTTADSDVECVLRVTRGSAVLD